MRNNKNFKRMLSLFLIFTIVLSGVVISPSIDGRVKFGQKVYAESSYVWKQKADAPFSQVGIKAETINGKIYVLEGGSYNSGLAVTHMLWEYTPETNTWEEKSYCPIKANFNDFCTAVANGKLYCFSPYHQNGYAVYNPLTEKWTWISELPMCDTFFRSAATINGKIYLFGGKDSEDVTLTTLYEYNPETNTWAKKASNSYGSYGHTAVVINDKMYIYGGFDDYGRKTIPYLSEYDPSTDQWTQKASNQEVAEHAAVVVNSRMYVLGGHFNGTLFQNMWEYDSIKNIWTKQQDTPSVWYNHASVAIGNKIYVLKDKSLWECTLFNYPTFNTISPVQNAVTSEADTNFIPKISICEASNNSLTCKYYIDSETTPRDTKIISNTTASQTVSFNALDIGTLSEGNHTIRFEVTDGYVTSPITQSVNFKVDKSNPVLGTVTRSSTINSITMSGSATDSITGLDANPYRYTIGSAASAWGTATTYTSSDNLVPNTKYAAKFEVKDAIGHIASSSQDIYTKAAVPKLAIENASSYTLDALVSDNNPSDTQYQICVNGLQYVTQEGTLTAAPSWITLTDKKITVTGLSPSQTYSFTAKARNGENVETAISSAASGTTLVAPPGSPENIIATATDKIITVSWDAVSGAIGYEIEMDGKTVDTGMATTYTHDGLYAGTPHTYRVRAKNEGGPGNWSSPISKSTLPVSPDIPTNLNAIPLSTSVAITWNSVPGATSYDIEVDGVQVENGPNTNYIHNSLTPGTHHEYRVRSINAGGKSEWSEYVKTTTQLNTAPVPANLKVEPAINSITLSWDTVSGATGYDVEVDGVTFDNGTNTNYTHSSLASDTQHIYRIRSKKGGVSSDWSAAIVATTLTNTFGTPANFTTNTDNSSVELSWDAVPEAIGYDVEIDGVVSDNEEDTTCIHNGLLPNSTHTYRVRARSATKTSEWTKMQTITVFALSTPKNVTATSDETTITVSWEPVEGATSYDIEFDDTILKATETTSTSIGLEPNSKHSIRVRAVSESGIGNWSVPLTKSTSFNMDNVPSVSGIARKNSIKIMWSEVEGAVSYDVEADGVITENVSGSAISLKGLEAGTKHTYRVRAENSSGKGNWSKAYIVSTLPLGPDKPSKVIASSNMTSILVSWDKVAGATEYEIEVDGKIINNGSGTSYLHTGLSPDTTHTYRVRSKNISSRSAWSDITTQKTVSSVQKYSINTTKDEEFDLALSALKIQDLEKYTFTIKYNTDDLELIDLCGFTSKLDTMEGDISNTDITIKQLDSENGTIVFVRTGSAQSWQVWSGIVNSIKFKSKRDGDSVITYTIQ